jgi:hypothetical protein
MSGRNNFKKLPIGHVSEPLICGVAIGTVKTLFFLFLKFFLGPVTVSEYYQMVM